MPRRSTSQKKSVRAVPLLPLVPYKSVRRKGSRKPKGNFFQRFIRLLTHHKLVVIGVIVVFLALFIGGSALFLKDLPSPAKLSAQSNFPISTKILDRKGRLLYEIYSDKNRTPIAISDLPNYVYQATIAIEDQNFYYHHGFDFGGMTRAIIQTFFFSTVVGFRGFPTVIPIF